MSTFNYRGLTESGEQVKGVIEAFDEVEAMEQAHELVYIVQEVTPVRSGGSLLQRDITKPKAKPKSLAIFCSQFAIMLRNGVQASQAMALVAEQTTDKYIKRVLKDAASDVASGHSIADSLQSKGSELPNVFIETIRAGELSGKLPEAFESLHKYYDKRDKVSAKVAQALTYPIFVMIIAVFVLAILMVLVIPRIAQMVASLGTDMPGITQWLIDTSSFFGTWWPLILILIIALIVAGKAYGKTEAGKITYATIKLKMPVLSPIVRNSCAAQFANTMATLMSAGLPMAKAINTTSRVLDNYVVAQEVSRMEAGIEEGHTLGECMKKSLWLPSTLTEMVSVGEQTGGLEETLTTMGEFYDSETQRVTEKALSYMEPALLIVMAIFVGFIVIALYLPLFTMYANL